MKSLSSVMDLLFPPKCVFCRKIKGGVSVCEKCAENLPYTKNGGRETGEFFDFCISPLYYKGVVRDSILRYKFGGAANYADTYAKILANCIREHLGDMRGDGQSRGTGTAEPGGVEAESGVPEPSAPGGAGTVKRGKMYDIISWVPLSGKRKRSRGYDQAMLLALATALELSDVAAETLKKTKDVQAQSEIKGRDARRVNISGAYEAADPELVEGKRVLLIDDVYTTGTTLSECARILLMAGAGSVVCAALARGE